MSIKYNDGPFDTKIPVYYVKPGELPGFTTQKAIPAEARVRMPSGKTIGPIGGECLRSALANGGVVLFDEETKMKPEVEAGPRIHVF
jgi:hypothetical protein